MKGHDHKPAHGTATDPVCGMRVDPAQPGAKREYKGHTYFFCSASCASTFDGDPAKYANA